MNRDWWNDPSDDDPWWGCVTPAIHKGKWLLPTKPVPSIKPQVSVTVLSAFRCTLTDDQMIEWNRLYRNGQVVIGGIYDSWEQFLQANNIPGSCPCPPTANP